MIKLLFIALVALNCFVVGEPRQLPTHHVHELADGLNVEGGIPYTSLNKEQTWVNLCAVLDRPFLDGADLAEITASNPFPLKESSIDTYNEAMVAYAFLTTFHYYATHAHEIAHKDKADTVRIVVQMHRNSSGEEHLKLLDKLMGVAFVDLLPSKIDTSAKNALYAYMYPEQNVVVEYRYGYYPESLQNYADQDIIISLSLASGFRPEWKSGTLILPEKFIPMDIPSMTAYAVDEYQAINHMSTVIADIVNHQKPAILDAVNDFFRSPNPVKAFHRAELLSTSDFHSATLLQANGLFNPKSLPDLITIE